jgi:hypothetical protein
MKTLLICGALLALTASLASAQGGLNISWTDCGTFGTQDRAFACNTNGGGNDIAVGSYLMPSDVAAATSNEIVIDLQSDSGTLPDWWQFTGCRAGSLTMSADFSANSNCFDYWGAHGGGSGGLGSYQAGFGGPNRARIIGVFAVSPANAGPIGPADGETYSFKAIINHAKTVGTGACSGCSIPVGLVLNEIKVTQPVLAAQGVGGGDVRINNALNRQFTSTQGGGNLNLPGATAAHKATWGSIKSLYR